MSKHPRDAEAPGDILVIDDAPSILQLLSGILAMGGYGVRTAESGAEGLCAVGEKIPDLILLDINMPQMDGFDVCRSLKSRDDHRDIPVIFISAAGEIAPKAEGFSLGAVDFIAKPFEVLEVLARVKTHMTIRSGRIKLETANRGLEKARDDLERLNRELEARVRRRTSELENANGALAESRERYREFVEGTDNLITQVDAEGRFTYVNHTSLKIFGIPPESCIGLSAFSFIHEDDRARTQAWFVHGIESRMEADTLENRQVSASGEVHDMSWTIKFHYNENGKLSHVNGIARDITERKRYEETLKEKEELLRKSQEIAHVGSWQLDPAGSHLAWSDETYRIFGRKPREIDAGRDAGRDAFLGAVHPEDRAAVKDAYMRSVRDGAEGYVIEHRVIRKDTGEVRHVRDECRHYRDASGNLLRSVGMVQDITERILEEKELKRLRNYLTNIIDSMPSVLVGVDENGWVTQWNQRAAETAGYSPSDAMGKPLSDLMPGIIPDVGMITESIRTREVKQERKKPRNTSGGTRYEDVTIYPLTANGEKGAVIRIDDVTHKVRMETMMVQSEKMLSVGGLAAGMAHEINNPLAGIMQTANVMTARLGGNPDMRANVKAAEAAGTTMGVIRKFMEIRGIPRMLDSINESGKRLAEIVDNMLSFARKHDDRTSSHDLGELLDKTLELAATDYDLKKHYDFKKIEIVKEYETNLPLIPCEGAKVQQVLLNILRNGSQAMQASRTENPRFIIRARPCRDRQMACMEIEDNGPGMDENTRNRAFEPFFTTKPVGAGTGLGLSVSYFIIVENHGGEMAVESRPGSGAKFIIRLPMRRSPT